MSTQPEGIETTSLQYDGNEITVSGFKSDYIFELIRNHKKFYELDLLEYLAHAILPAIQGVIIDAGANLGNHTIFFAKVLGRNVISVEPEENNFHLLHQNVKLNGIQGQVELVRAAVFDQETNISLGQSIENNRGTFFIENVGGGDISATTIDKIVGERKVAAIKLDIEGSEIPALFGAQGVIGRDHPVLIIESQEAGELQRVGSWMADHDYISVATLGRSDNIVWMHESSDYLAAAIENLRTNQRNDFRFISSALDRDGRRLLESLDLLNNLAKTNEKIQIHNSEAGESLDEIKATFLESTQTLAREIKLLEVIEKYIELDRQRDVVSPSDLNKVESSVQSVLGELRPLRSELQDRLSWYSKNIVDVLSPAAKETRNELASIKEAVRELSIDLEQLHTNAIREMQSNFKDEITKANESTAVQQSCANDRFASSIVKAFEELDSRLQSRFDSLLDAMRTGDAEGKSTNVHQKDLNRVLYAYQALSERFERVAPHAWSSDSAKQAMMNMGLIPSNTEISQADQIFYRQALDAPRELEQSQIITQRSRVRIGIASMPGREQQLDEVLSILSPQADEIFVYLNGMSTVPEEISYRRNVRFFTGPDLGDRGKFQFIDNFQGYYLTCDDDIAYAPYHVNHIVDGIERYGRRAVVGWHGSIFSDNFESFYDSASRKVLSFRFLRGKDTAVHLLGTGVAGFHTDTLQPVPSDFEYPNMADVFMARLCQRQQIPMIVLAHRGGEATPLETPGSISAASIGKDDRGQESFNVAEVSTKLVKQMMPWRVYEAKPVYVRKVYRAAIVGRTDKFRWKKGGILKSCHLTQRMLHGFGWDARLFDIETGDPIGLEGFGPELVMVYVGDPERPDFQQVVHIVEHHASKGVPVIINLSDNGRDTRLSAIAAQMMRWRSKFGNLIALMVFTSETRNRPEYSQIRDMIVTIPKTLTYPEHPDVDFNTTRGVFVGDIAKLSDPSLLGQDGKEWIRAIREALPGEPIFGVKQYRPKYDVDFGLDEVWPFLQGQEFAEKISQTRLMVSAVRYATFEMVPAEVASLGIPIVHRPMPQSLSSYLGLTSVSVDTPTELKRVLPMLYHDPMVWRAYSHASKARALSNELVVSSAPMHVALSSFIQRVRGR